MPSGRYWSENRVVLKCLDIQGFKSFPDKMCIRDSLAPIAFGRKTAIGALAQYVSHGGENEFQPMNVNFGILAPYEARIRSKKDRYHAIAERSLDIVRMCRAEMERGQAWEGAK